MKPSIRRTVGFLILLAVSGFLGSCCSLCKKCPENAECEIIPSNAATEIMPAAGNRTLTSDNHEPSGRDTTLPEEWRVSYPMFEGDYFSITLPAKPVTSASRDETDDSAEEPSQPTISAGVPNPSAVHTRVPTQIIGRHDQVVWTDGVNKVVLKGKYPVHFEFHPIPAETITNIQHTVEKIVEHLGFYDPTGIVLKQEFFEIGPHISRYDGGDILKVAQINCETTSQSGTHHFCELKDDEKLKLIERASGMTPDAFLNRNLIRFYFFQRPQYREWPLGSGSPEILCTPDSTQPDKCNVFIEHVAIAATARPDGTATSVNGRVFSSYKVTNRPKLPPEQAIEKAYKKLWKIPKISPFTDQLTAETNPPLVLLPYSYATKFDLKRIHSHKWPGYRVPQLRYAYRTTLYGNFDEAPNHHVEAASWRAWVDAETGDILQLFPQFAFDGVATADASGKGWPQSPTFPVTTLPCPDPGSDDCPVERNFEVDMEVSSQGSEQFCLQLAGVLDPIEFDDYTNEPIRGLCSTSKDFAPIVDKEPWDYLCLEDKEDDDGNGDLTAVHYLLMNAYSHVYAYKKKLDAAICSDNQGNPIDITPICVGGKFQAAKNETDGAYVPLRIMINNKTSRGRYAAPMVRKDGAIEYSPHLTIGDIGGRFTDWDKCATNETGMDKTAPNRPGGQDSTVMTHEFAHVVMKGLHESAPSNWCMPSSSNCPVPLSSVILHDMADGLSAVSNITDSFGAWYANSDLQNHDEVLGSPRKFEYAPGPDHFPEHRNWITLRHSPGADDWIDDSGQIDFIPKSYADGQIAAAALWAVTESMNRWVEKAGPAAFEVKLLNVLHDNFIPNVCTASKHGRNCDYPDDCDIDVYRYLHFLLDDLIHNDKTTGVTVNSNKMTAGFAKAGIFLVPPQCIDNITQTSPTDQVNDYCPFGEYGGDAIIDIKDNWLNHQDATDVPEFEVWTGPRFRFQQNHAKLAQGDLLPPPCNQYYKIIIANNPKFESKADSDQDENNHNLRKETAWLDAGAECYANWKLPLGGEWEDFWKNITKTSRDFGQTNLHYSRAYYQVVTGDSNAVNAIPTSSSLLPGEPFFNSEMEQGVNHPPFAVLNDTGEQQPGLLNDPR